MSQICSKMVTFLFSAYFGCHFCYNSKGKSQINTRLLHFGYSSYKLMRNCFSLIGGGGGGGGGQNNRLGIGFVNFSDR